MVAVDLRSLVAKINDPCRRALESADREIALFFGEGEILDYPRDVDRWIFENPAAQPVT